MRKTKTKIQYIEPLLIMQTLILLPIFPIPLSDKVLSFYRATRHLLLSFSFIPIDTEIFGVSSSEKSNDYLLLIDIKSENTFANILQILIIFAIVMIFLLTQQLLKLYFDRYKD